MENIFPKGFFSKNIFLEKKSRIFLKVQVLDQENRFNAVLEPRSYNPERANCKRA